MDKQSNENKLTALHIALNVLGWASLKPTMSKMAAKLALGTRLSNCGKNATKPKIKKPWIMADILVLPPL